MFPVHGNHSKFLIPVAHSSVAFIIFINRSRHLVLSIGGLFQVNYFIIYFNTSRCLSYVMVLNVYSSLNARSYDYDIDLVHWRLINGCQQNLNNTENLHAIICRHFILNVYNLYSTICRILKCVYFEVITFWKIISHKLMCFMITISRIKVENENMFMSSNRAERPSMTY